MVLLFGNNNKSEQSFLLDKEPKNPISNASPVAVDKEVDFSFMCQFNYIYFFVIYEKI